jgi:hypothetical protein
MKEKQYEVEIYASDSHGCWGKQHYFGWVISSDKIANAESFALDILAGMTPNEINKEADGKFFHGITKLYGFVPNGDGTFRYVPLDNDKPIGYKEAERRFTVKARVFRG